MQITFLQYNSSSSACLEYELTYLYAYYTLCSAITPWRAFWGALHYFVRSKKKIEFSYGHHSIFSVRRKNAQDAL